MIESKHSQFILLFFLFPPLIHYKADAQSAIQPVPMFAARRSLDPSTAIMVAALICAFFLVGVFSLYLRHCAERYFLEPNPIGAPTDWPCSCSQGIEKKVLDTFPIFVYSNIKDLKIGKGTLECAVCLSEFKDCETLRLLPKCNHAFHPECIDAWLASHDTCPVCRERLKPDSGEVAIFVPSQLNSNELDDESAVNRAEEGETEQQPAVTDANEEQTTKMDEVATKQDHLPKSIMSRKLSRSNSTGHSLVEPGNNVERYTLRLPEDVRKYIILNHGRIQRSASYHVIGNSKKGLCWIDCEGSKYMYERQH